MVYYLFPRFCAEMMYMLQKYHLGLGLGLGFATLFIIKSSHHVLGSE